MYPALTVTEKIKTKPHQLLWVGGDGGMEASLVEREGIPYQSIPAAGLHGVSLAKLPGNLWKLLKGYQKSIRILKEFKPDVLLFTGGYLAFPMALAGRNKPILLFVPDIEPGMALKALSSFADKIALTVDQSRQFFNYEKRTIVTGYPLRDDLKNWSKAEAAAYFQFDPEVPTLLFLGGSSGARSINNAVVEIAGTLVERFQVIHLTGHLDWETVRAKNAHLSARYQAFPYLHEIGAAYAAADLVISRSGASTLGEYPYFGLPAILVPYPYAWRYQKVNADYLVEHGGAILLEDAHLNTELLPTILRLMDDPYRLARMSQAMSSLAEPDAAERIAALLFDMAEA